MYGPLQLYARRGHGSHSPFWNRKKVMRHGRRLSWLVISPPACPFSDLHRSLFALRSIQKIVFIQKVEWSG